MNGALLILPDDNGDDGTAFKMQELLKKEVRTVTASEVLFATKLVDNGKEQVLELQAPKEPGSSPFVCTFPGYHILMRGVMKVTQ
jgi:azurin